MNPQNTPFTVQLGQGASICFGSTRINTGAEGATIRFGNIEAPLNAPTYGPTARGQPEERPYRTDTIARRAHLPVQRPKIAESAAEVSREKASVFERLGRPEAQAIRKTANTAYFPAAPFAAGKNDAEASSSGGRPSRRKRRAAKARREAQGLPSELPVMQEPREPVIAVPTQNKFADLKWVKRNSSTGELKQSFWAPPQHQAPVPQRRGPETISARVHRTLKAVKEEGLMKKKYQYPAALPVKRADASRLPPPARGRGTLERGPPRRDQTLQLGTRSREPVSERANCQERKIWRPRSHERANNKMKVAMPGERSRMSSATKTHQEWIPKRGIHIDDRYDGRHPGDSSRRSRHDRTLSPKREVHFDRSPPIEERFIQHAEPEVNWKRRPRIQVREGHEDEVDETVNVEVVYVVGHIPESSGRPTIPAGRGVTK